jgi:hypothetical protein
MKTRINPLAAAVPVAVPAAEIAGVDGKTAVTSGRLSNDVLGSCPICETAMPIVEVGDVTAYVCTAHCICTPTKNAPTGA